jgi:hypothetical protein
MLPIDEEFFQKTCKINESSKIIMDQGWKYTQTLSEKKLA